VKRPRPLHTLRHLPKTAFRFAVFGVVCLVLLVGLAAKIGNLSLFSSRHALYAELADVTGLAPGDEVAVAGVPVGQVGSISVQHGHALVGLDLRNTLVLHQGTDVGLRWHNVIGQKEVYLYPSSQGPVLGPGATLPLSHDVSDASVNAFLNSFGPFLSAINAKQANAFVQSVSGALEGDSAEIDQLINNGAKVSSTVGALDTQVGSVIDSLDQVLTAVASRSGDIGSLVDNLQTVAQSLASHNDTLDSVVTNLSQVAGDLASLVSSNHSSLTSTIDNLETVASTIQAHQQELAQSLASSGSGLAPYVEISSVGQWFQVQTVYTCLANQSSCSYFQPASPPAGSGPGGGPPLSPPSAPSLPSAPSASGAGGPGPSTIPQILSSVARGASGSSSGQGS
jgi:phospholipid/cholesterol/gamma-HCH transport system substrate-binding protein